MPRPFACALGCALIVAAGLPAAPIPQHLMKQPVYYFPTKVGAKLVYEEPGSETERVLIITAVKDCDGMKIVTVGRFQAQGEIVWPYSTMAITGSGIYRLKRGDEKLPAPEQWLKLPAERGLSWKSVSAPDIPPLIHTVTGHEEVTVPAGTFQCVRVQLEEDRWAATCWFAPEVGVVKSEAPTWTEVLKSYTPGKD